MGLIAESKLSKAIIGLLLIALPSFFITGSYLASDAVIPMEGYEENPFPDEPLTDGLLFVVIDGGRQDMMSNPEYMPNLNSRVEDGVYMEVRTNPLTMTAICIKEMATGVPSRPNEALDNFKPTHPGSLDGWNLLVDHDADNDGTADNNLGIIGDYVWKYLYPDREKVPFSKHRYGHADYYLGDEEAFVTLNNWISGEIPEGYEKSPNAIITHLSGLDSVGHRYMVNSDEYKEKLLWLDEYLEEIFSIVPDNWTVVVTSDHGLTETGQHGSPEEIIRQTPAFMWGPNIKKGVVIKDMIQRDLATLPSILFSLPLPHAVHGQIPLDAFDISEEKRQAYEEWNWKAAVERNNWFKDNNLPYVEGLSKDEIEWDKLPEDELGIRSIDVWISIIAIFASSVLVYRIFKSSENTKINANQAGFGFVILFTLSITLSYNRDILAPIYYPLGLLCLVATCILCWHYMNRENEEISEKYHIALLSLIVFSIIYPETRFTVIGVMIIAYFLINKETYKITPGQISHTNRMIFYPFLGVLIAGILFSDYRLLGFSAPRFMVIFSQSYESTEVLSSCAIAFFVTFIYSKWSKNFTYQTSLILAGLFGIVPFMISQDSNSVDWVLLSGLIISSVTSLIFKLKGKDNSATILYYSAFFWLNMSWGAWACGISMLYFAAIESFSQNEWHDFMKPKENSMQEFTRKVLLGVIPLGIWFAWWATLGQTDGLLHTRDIDPGNLFLKGGYIGDRVSPSNTWVFVMGAGPAILVGSLWYDHFRRMGWPLKYALFIFCARLAALSIQLSISPNLPRLVFKIGWDLLFGLIITSVIFVFFIIQYRDEKKTAIIN